MCRLSDLTWSNFWESNWYLTKSRYSDCSSSSRSSSSSSSSSSFVVILSLLFCIIVVNNDYDWLIDLNYAFAPGFRLLCVFQRTLSSVLSKIGNENCVFDYLIAGSNEYEFCLVCLITLIISLLWHFWSGRPTSGQWLKWGGGGSAPCSHLSPLQ